MEILHALLIISHFSPLLNWQDLFQMGSSAYPAMSQPFSMSHSSNMSSVGVRQDSMSRNILNLI